MTIADVIQVLDDLKATNLVLLCHHNADPDAICSAYAFQGLLTRLRPNINSEIGIGQGISKLAKNILKYIPMNISSEPDVEKTDAIILLDTNTVQQLGHLTDRVKKLMRR